MNIFIMGMIFAGAGGGICELISLAATGEMVPTKKRGLYVGLVISSILPFCPAVLWAQLIAQHNWRFNGLFCGLWSLVGLVLTVTCYTPPPRVNASGLTRKEIVKRIDFVGGLLSVSGLVLFLAALQWGGAQYPWASAHVLAPLFIGVALLVAFAVWEFKGTKYPMFPARLKKDPRNLYLILFITAISGANFFAILVWWPVQSYAMYDPNPINVGIRSLPIGFGIIVGAMIIGFLITALNGRIKLLLTISCCIMTAGESWPPHPYSPVSPPPNHGY
jgi:MFS family permease